jgi:sulfopyruvate decarboxylase TPP-binding subunit
LTPEAADKVVAGLKQAGIDFVAYLPETRLSEILPVLRADDSFTLVPVASEAEAVGIAAVASLGGKQPALYMEGTGLFVASYGVPMLLLISDIGSMADGAAHFYTPITAPIWCRNGRRWESSTKSSSKLGTLRLISRTRCG